MVQVAADHKKHQKKPDVLDELAAQRVHQLLFAACLSDNFKDVKQALAQGANPNSVESSWVGLACLCTLPYK